MTMTSANDEPSPINRTREQVELIESSGGTRGTTMRGMPVIVVTTVGARTGTVRKFAVMRVEHDGAYAIVASIGGAPKNPAWYWNLVARPEVTIQDGPQVMGMRARELSEPERAVWWQRAVDAFPDYEDYRKKTARIIPVFLAEPVVEPSPGTE